MPLGALLGRALRAVLGSAGNRGGRDMSTASARDGDAREGGAAAYIHSVADQLPAVTRLRMPAFRCKAGDARNQTCLVTLKRFSVRGAAGLQSLNKLAGRGGVAAFATLISGATRHIAMEYDNAVRYGRLRRALKPAKRGCGAREHLGHITG